MDEPQQSAKPTEARMSDQCTAGFLVYKGERFLGRRLFPTEGRVHIGSGCEADILLNHQEVQADHAIVYMDGTRLVLENRCPDDGLQVNGISVRSALLKTRDVVGIGPYSIRVEIDEANRKNSRGRAVDHPQEGRTGQTDKPPQTVQEPGQKPEKQVKAVSRQPAASKPSAWNLLPATPLVPDVEASLLDFGGGREAFEDEDEDEDEAGWIVPFSLKNRLSETPSGDRPYQHDSRQLSVIKSRGDTITDASLLSAGSRCSIPEDTKGRGSRPLARLTRKGAGYVYFSARSGGSLTVPGQPEHDLKRYKIAAYLHSRRKQIYRITLPANAAAVIREGETEYHVSHAVSAPAPPARPLTAERRVNWRHWAASAGVHLFLILTAALVYQIQFAAPVKEGPRFVKLVPSPVEALEEPDKQSEPAASKSLPPELEPRAASEKAHPPQKTIAQSPASRPVNTKSALRYNPRNFSYSMEQGLHFPEESAASP